MNLLFTALFNGLPMIYRWFGVAAIIGATVTFSYHKGFAASEAKSREKDLLAEIHILKADANAAKSAALNAKLLSNELEIISASDKKKIEDYENELKNRKPIIGNACSLDRNDIKRLQSIGRGKNSKKPAAATF